MKIIDLLNKIANGEEVPEQIKIQGCTYYLCKDDGSGQCYFSEKQGFGGFGLKFNTSQLDEEVEIIEEDKKIEKLDYVFDVHSPTYNESWLMTCIKANKDKIDEIIDYINKGDK